MFLFSSTGKHRERFYKKQFLHLVNFTTLKFIMNLEALYYQPIQKKASSRKQKDPIISKQYCIIITIPEDGRLPIPKEKEIIHPAYFAYSPQTNNNSNPPPTVPLSIKSAHVYVTCFSSERQKKKSLFVGTARLPGSPSERNVQVNIQALQGAAMLYGNCGLVRFVWASVF